MQTEYVEILLWLKVSIIKDNSNPSCPGQNHCLERKTRYHELLTKNEVPLRALWRLVRQPKSETYPQATCCGLYTKNINKKKHEKEIT